MPKTGYGNDDARQNQDGPDGAVEYRCQKTLLKTGALQDAIFNSAYFSSIATEEKGVIQIYNVGAERTPGYAASNVVNLTTSAEFSDPQELIERAAALSLKFDTPITPVLIALWPQFEQELYAMNAFLDAMQAPRPDRRQID